MNVVDSNGWVEFLTGGEGAGFFADPILRTNELIVPAICFYEVYRLTLRERGEDAALTAIAPMRKCRIVDMTADLAISAAAIGHELKLAAADSVILATARAHDAVLWTQDADFAKVAGVKYRAKRG